MIQTQQKLGSPLKKLSFKSPPRTKPAQQEISSSQPFESVTLSQARTRKEPGLSTLQKVGLTIGVTAAVGGAFIAGATFNQEMATESEFQTEVNDLERDLSRGTEDVKTGWKRGVEDFKTEWKRGMEDLREGEPTPERQLERDLEDLGRQIKRDAEDTGKEIGRAARDFWREITK